ncbi:MAG: FAD-dependent oxidoreductase [Acidobacteria bacterium]|nr:FAD-dependent oxidoreductase [Acidobacteriota bacterium]
MIRDLSRLTDGDFDVLVVGGGVYGLTAAYDAAQRGLSVGLVERSDFGSATSFNHLKTIHGGLRYLQSADVTRMRESIAERRTFARIAPRFVAPLPFIMPTSPTLTGNPLAMKVALALDAYISADRNEGLDAAHQLPAGRVVSAAEAHELLGAMAPPGMGPAAVWYDYETIQGDRLTLAFAHAAAHHGAVLANYVEAVAPRWGEDRKLRAITAKDALTGERFDIRARVIVNAAGPWVAAFLHQLAINERWPLLKAMNLVTSRPAAKAALVARTRRGRALVLLPWQGRTLVGTSESSDERPADDQKAAHAETQAFLLEVNEAFPALDLTSDEVTLVHRGIVPARTRGGRLSLLGHSRIVDHAEHGLTDVISVIGAKYTTARIIAERTIDLVLRKLGRPEVPSRTSTVTLPGAALTDGDAVDPIAHAIREEMAQTLADVVVRRTGVGAAGHPGDAIAARVADCMQQELSWTDQRKHDELAALQRFYDLEPTS